MCVVTIEFAFTICWWPLIHLNTKILKQCPDSEGADQCEECNLPDVAEPSYFAHKDYVTLGAKFVEFGGPLDILEWI